MLIEEWKKNETIVSKKDFFVELYDYEAKELLLSPNPDGSSFFEHHLPKKGEVICLVTKKEFENNLFDDEQIYYVQGLLNLYDVVNKKHCVRILVKPVPKDLF